MCQITSRFSDSIDCIMCLTFTPYLPHLRFKVHETSDHGHDRSLTEGY